MVDTATLIFTGGTEPQTPLTIPLVLDVPAAASSEAAPALPPPVPHGSLGSSLLSTDLAEAQQSQEDKEKESVGLEISY